MAENWEDHLAGARMRVDRQFEDRVTDSRFSNQQWGLIMTAVRFDITSPEDPDRAEMVADTEDLDAIIPELDRIEQEMSGNRRDPDGGGLLGRLRDAFGSLSGGSGSSPGEDQKRKDEARVLVDEYAEHLQAYLEDNGRWAEICAMADGTDEAGGDGAR
jgi:hypothetical protein